MLTIAIVGFAVILGPVLDILIVLYLAKKLKKQISSRKQESV